jgi:hypothetical protein
MNKLYLAVALGSMAASAQVAAQGQVAAAQAPAGNPQPDITRMQAKQFADALFQRLDLNHDGTATRDEAEQARTQMGGHGHIIERTFGTAQSLNLAQFEAAALASFDAEDTNHDGVASAAEREQARALRQAHKGQ